jgi:HAD superfamily hydrolase (TIGR01549 family)
MKNALLIFDIDNTLAASYGIYDEAYRLTSGEVLGKEFIMTRHPDGSEDNTFSKKSNPEILEHRAMQLGIDPNSVDHSHFFKRFDENAKVAAETSDFVIFPGVPEFLKKLAESYKLIVLTSGSRELQLTVLRRAGIIDYFDIKQSFFLGDYKSKQEAIERAHQTNSSIEVVAHFGDAPKDMLAIKNADIPCKKIPVGVTVAKLSTPEELKKVGADLIIEEYNEPIYYTLIKVLS